MKFCNVAPPYISSSYKERAEKCTHPLAKRLFTSMADKQSNLAVALDVTDRDEFLRIAQEVAPHICVLKTHIDIVDDFDWGLVEQLQALAYQHNFLIFEDRKFADIGNTVKHQYGDGVYRIAEWAHLTNAHILPGPGIIEGLREVGLPRDRGLLLIAELSSKGSWATGPYSEAAIMLAKQYPDFVMGFITQKCLSDNPGLVHMTPGVKLDEKGDKLGQQYHTPEQVIGKQGSDVAIVGRAIIQDKDPAAAAARYQEACWSAYEARLKQTA